MYFYQSIQGCSNTRIALWHQRLECVYDVCLPWYADRQSREVLMGWPLVSQDSMWQPAVCYTALQSNTSHWTNHTVFGDSFAYFNAKMTLAASTWRKTYHQPLASQIDCKQTSLSPPNFSLFRVTSRIRGTIVWYGDGRNLTTYFTYHHHPKLDYVFHITTIPNLTT